MILDTIIAQKKEEIAEAQRTVPAAHVRAAAECAPAARDFIGAISRPRDNRNRIIAEVKKASPSKGVLRDDFDHLAIARDYEDGGAAAISVLTDVQFFMGCGSYLSDIKQAGALPVLRKDFIIDAYQIYESRSLGADALLLIAAALSAGHMTDLLHLAGELGMQALIEVHTAAELDIAMQAGAQCLGINNRNLNTFTTDIRMTLDLIKAVPDSIPVVSESGIHTPAHIRTLKRAGVSAFLIGEALMRSAHPGDTLAEFVRA